MDHVHTWSGPYQSSLGSGPRLGFSLVWSTLVLKWALRTCQADPGIGGGNATGFDWDWPTGSGEKAPITLTFRGFCWSFYPKRRTTIHTHIHTPTTESTMQGDSQLTRTPKHGTLLLDCAVIVVVGWFKQPHLARVRLDSGAGWTCTHVVRWSINVHRLNQPSPQTHSGCLWHGSKEHRLAQWVTWLQSNKPVQTTSIKCPCEGGGVGGGGGE